MATLQAYNEARSLLLDVLGWRPFDVWAPAHFKQSIAAWLAANPAVDEAAESAAASMAYQFAAGVIESSCLLFDENKDQPIGSLWYDLDGVDDMVVDVNEEADYLDSRRLLFHHPDHPRWIRICDEDEPLPLPGAETAVTG